MFTEKDKEQAKIINNQCDDFITEKTANMPIYNSIGMSAVTAFLFLKIAQLENENKRLSDRIERLAGDHEVMT